uniref:PKD domain-containing protein n=1 Tax=Nippostrongylus brasiliensis TaxID=27835 RepID=A0A0N4YQI9_NIPBR
LNVSGTATSILTLKNVQANEKYGPYEFELHVKDTKGQTDSTRISIFVNKAENLPPTADAGGNHTVILPETSIVLDGNAKDDGSIVSYKWTQIAGPNNAFFVNGDKAKATVSNLMEGLYHFVLTVTDDGGLNGTASAFIAVERSMLQIALVAKFLKIFMKIPVGKNEPPVARASNVTVHLPRTIAVLNASLSTDDAGIVAFRWQPLDSVPASMVALDNSENSAVMFLTGLVKGVHFYNLTVADLQNEQDSVLVQLTVEEGEEEMESVEILMKKNIQEWTYRLRRKFRDRIEASLASSIEESDSVDVHFTRFESLPQDGRLRAVFWAKYHSKSAAGQETMKHKRSLASSGNVVNALRAVNILRKETSMMKEFQISSIQTLYCKLNCSGHGHCNDATKQCECDNFWMGNVFAFLINDFRTEDCGTFIPPCKRPFTLCCGGAAGKWYLS